MKIFIALVKAQFISQFLDKTKKTKKWLLYLFVGLAFLPILALLGLVIYGAATLVSRVGAEAEFFSILVSVAQVIIVFMGLVTLINQVYFSSDNEMLLSLPVKPAIVFLSKLFVVYFNELLLAVLLGLGVFIPLGIGVSAGALYYAAIPFLIILLPILPLTAAAILSVPMMYVVSFFKKRGALSSVILLLIFAVLFGGYYLLIGNSGGLDYLGSLDEAELIRVVTTPIINIGQKLFPNFVLGRAVFAPDFAAFISNFAISIAILSGLFVVAVFVASLCYNRAVSSQLETPKSLKTKDRELRSDKNILVTLIKKEWTEIIKEPSIAFYCLMQVLFAPIMIFAMSITMPPELSAGSVATDSNLMLVIITVAQLFFVLAMGMTGATSITRENKNFYIMKVIPVAYETQIKAKVYIGVIITTVSLILSNVIALIAFKTDVFFTVVAAGFLIILGYAASMQSTALDLNKPRLNWQTVTEGLKNNSAQLVGMIYSLGGILIFGGLAGLTFWLYATSNLSILFYAMWAVFYLIALLLAYMFKKHLYKNLSEKIEAIAH